MGGAAGARPSDSRQAPARAVRRRSRARAAAQRRGRRAIPGLFETARRRGRAAHAAGAGRGLRPAGAHRDRQSVGWGKSVSVRVDLGGRRISKKKKKKKKNTET